MSNNRELIEEIIVCLSNEIQLCKRYYSSFINKKNGNILLGVGERFENIIFKAILSCVCCMYVSVCLKYINIYIGCLLLYCDDGKN